MYVGLLICVKYIVIRVWDIFNKVLNIFLNKMTVAQEG